VTALGAVVVVVVVDLGPLIAVTMRDVSKFDAASLRHIFMVVIHVRIRVDFAAIRCLWCFLGHFVEFYG